MTEILLAKTKTIWKKKRRQESETFSLSFRSTLRQWKLRGDFLINFFLRSLFSASSRWKQKEIKKERNEETFFLLVSPPSPNEMRKISQNPIFYAKYLIMSAG